MPNHCWNYLSVDGPEEDLMKFHSMIDFDDFMGSFIPVPEEVKTMNDIDVTSEEEKAAIAMKYGVGSWYDFVVKRYGSKWCDFSCDKDPDPGDYGFDSAWAPPLAGLQKISGMFPTLTFTIEYDEGSMVFQGISTFRAGEIVCEEYREGDDYICTCEWEECERCFPDTWEEAAEKNKEFYERRRKELAKEKTNG